jgi:hypothetical protein
MTRAFGRKHRSSAHDDDQLHDEGYGEDEDRDAELDAWGEAGVGSGGGVWWGVKGSEGEGVRKEGSD